MSSCKRPYSRACSWSKRCSCWVSFGPLVDPPAPLRAHRIVPERLSWCRWRSHPVESRDVQEKCLKITASSARVERVLIGADLASGGKDAAMQDRKHRPFLSRPFYRDYVMAYVCIASGAVICDLAVSPKMRVLPLLFGATIAFAG